MAASSRNYSHIRFLGDLNKNLVHEIERFFVSYNETKGKGFDIIGPFSPDRARAPVDRAVEKYLDSRHVAKRSTKK